METLTPTGARQPADEFERRYGKLGGREMRVVPFEVDEVRDSGAGGGQFTVVGHAAVFNQWSLDLGFFREKIAPGAFDDALSRNPDVWHLWDHDTRYVLSRTTNKTLELSLDPRGLRYWSRVAPTSYAADLRVLLERGDVNQSSFAFDLDGGEDEWVIRTADDGSEVIERTIVRVGNLYDVTTTAMGAYPQTDSAVARSRILAYAREIGALPAQDAGASSPAAPVDPVDGDPSRSAGGDEVLKRLSDIAAVARISAGRASIHRK